MNSSNLIKKIIEKYKNDNNHIAKIGYHNNNYTISNNPFNVMFIIGFAFTIIALLLSLAIIISSLIITIKGKSEDVSKFTLIIKLIAIPWYIANYVMWVLAVLGMLNPILFLAIPIVIALSMTGTYLFMISVSIHNLLPTFYLLIKKKIKLNPLLVIGIIFHFIFCLDILGAIFILINNKRQLSTK